MTKIFLDTANLDEIKFFLDRGIGDGVTTNQRIFLKEGGIDFKQRVLDICEFGFGEWDFHVSVETTSKGIDNIINEGLEYASWHRKIVVKIAIDGAGDGLAAIHNLKKKRKDIKINATCMVNFNQLFLADKAGADYVSFFFNRSRDAGYEPIDFIENYRRSDCHSQLIVGSIRSPLDFEQAVVFGADIVTVPPKILHEMMFDQKTEDTIKEFDDAWKEFQSK